MPLLQRPDNCPSETKATSLSRPAAYRKHDARGRACHRRSTLGPASAQHQDVARPQLASLHAANRHRNIVVNDRRAFEVSVLSRTLQTWPDDRALRCQRTTEHDDRCVFREGPIEWTNHVCIMDDGVAEALAQRAPADGDRLEIE